MPFGKTLNFVFLLGLLAFFFAATETAEAKKKEKWTKISYTNFPAHVKLIVLQDKTELRPGGSFKVGNWTIRMLSTSPVARMQAPAGQVYRGITIDGFTCGNPIDGEGTCFMSFNEQIRELAYLGTNCSMVLNITVPGTNAAKTLSFPCPRDLILDIN